MLTYRIGLPKETPNPPTSEDDKTFLSKSAILDRALSKMWFAVGDRVKFKKPKRNPWYGTIVDIERDWTKVTWTQGGLCPNFITLQMEKGPNEKVKTTAKKLHLVLTGANRKCLTH